jgi:dTDP-N-acetylfucosamine:lipid II N-acetylfucosaminyltransferase
MNILHIAPDYKFIPFVADTFNAFDNTSNLFLMNVGNISAHPHIDKSGNMRFVDSTYFASNAMADDLAWCDCLIVHFLYDGSAKMILKAPSHVTVVWSGWGGDYYELLFPEYKQNLLGDNTKDLVAKIKDKEPLPAPSLLRYTISRLSQLKKDFVHHRLMQNVIKRVDFFSAPIREDYALIQAGLGAGFRAQYIQLNYVSVEHTFAPGSSITTGNNIMVGNSATPTNNHIEIFRTLAKLDLGERKIIVPLSYSDPDYRDAIILYGNELFGTRFQPIVDFMPLDKYNALIAECSIVIMGHRRQQALGNICTMLYKGAKVFVSEDSVVYQFFKNCGAFVYGLRDLIASGGEVFAPLADEQKKKNREVLESHWGQDVVLRNVRNLIEMVQARREVIA